MAKQEQKVANTKTNRFCRRDKSVRAIEEDLGLFSRGDGYC